MKNITINTRGLKSEILIGEKWESVVRLLPQKGVVIITDENVRSLYGDRFPAVPVFSVEPGEGSKKLEAVERLAQQLLEAEIDRSGFILAIGGGVVCDLAGFIASIYLRGIRCGYVSSTLLSQVDASTGGKNGVNLGGTKNILGIIRQPEFVICDPMMLLTLSEKEYLSGLAELIKTAIIGDRELFDIIDRSYKEIMDRDFNTLTLLVSRSVSFKASVVNEDEMETGLRRILNFGHTYGHVIEMQNHLEHGLAVAAGMEAASAFSLEKGFISLGEVDKINRLLERFGLLSEHNIADRDIEKLILNDKKKSGADIHFVFTKGIGKAVVKAIPVAEVIDYYKRFRDKKTGI